MSDKDKKRTAWHFQQVSNNKRPRGDDTKGSRQTTLAAIRHGRAILATCDKGREKDALRELRSILERYLEEAREVPAIGDAAQGDQKHGSATVSLRESIQKEVEELRAKHGEEGSETWAVIDTGVGGVTGLSLPKSCPLNPADVCSRILDEAVAGKKQSRHIIKLLPFERICYSDVPTVLKEMSELLQPHAQPDNAQDDASGKLPTLMVSLNRRSDDSFRRAELFAVLNDILKDRFKVDLASPQKVVLVELMRGNAGIAVVERFNERKKFNLRLLQDAAAGREPKRKTEANAGGTKEGV